MTKQGQYDLLVGAQDCTLYELHRAIRSLEMAIEYMEELGIQKPSEMAFILGYLKNKHALVKAIDIDTLIT